MTIWPSQATVSAELGPEDRLQVQLAGLTDGLAASVAYCTPVSPARQAAPSPLDGSKPIHSFRRQLLGYSTW